LEQIQRISRQKIELIAPGQGHRVFVRSGIASDRRTFVGFPVCRLAFGPRSLGKMDYRAGYGISRPEIRRRGTGNRDLRQGHGFPVASVTLPEPPKHHWKRNDYNYSSAQLKPSKS